jgi:two-component system, OmpR family, KDP operon response regulator KdpE
MSELPKLNILAVDDERAIRKLLERGLSGYGYEIITSDNGNEAVEIVVRDLPDVILLDINLGKHPDGLEICCQIREWSKVPIIMLTVRDEKEIKLATLNAGADDYITKPFDMEELEARIRAVVRRSAYQGTNSQTDEITFDDLVIDLVKRRVTLKGEEVHLTPREYALLKVLATNPGKVMTFKALLEQVWGKFYGTKPEHNVRVYINTLRKKLKDDPSTTHKPHFIFNEPGIGYRFADL